GKSIVQVSVAIDVEGSRAGAMVKVKRVGAGIAAHSAGHSSRERPMSALEPLKGSPGLAANALLPRLGIELLCHHSIAHRNLSITGTCRRIHHKETKHTKRKTKSIHDTISLLHTQT